LQALKAAKENVKRLPTAGRSGLLGRTHQREQIREMVEIEEKGQRARNAPEPMQSGKRDIYKPPL